MGSNNTGFQRKQINKTRVNSVIGSRTGTWWKYLTQHRVQWKYLFRVFTSSLVILIGIPFRMWERFRVGKKIEQIVIHDTPIFILGHWRGGTTLLHNLLCKDPRFGYVTYLQGLFPHAFLASGFFRFIAKTIMPKKRPMDNMEIDINSPQEEELALMAQSGHSVYNMWLSPDDHWEMWQRYGRLEHNNPTYKNKWNDGYIGLLKAATFNFNGKPLVLKNPPNTARIPYLLEQFPNAKFIHIYRNPYKVYASTFKLYRDVINFFQLHDEVEKDMNANVVRIYQDMYDSYQKNKQLIPKENLIEIKFEDFVKDKEGGLKNIYQQLKIGDYQEVESIYKEYLSSIKSYKKNKLRTDDEVIRAVNEHWGFAIEDFGYEREEMD